MTFSMLQMQSPLFTQQLLRSVNVMNQCCELRSVTDPVRCDQHLACAVKELTPVIRSAENSTLQSKLQTKVLQIAEPDCNAAIICNSGN